MIEDLIAYLLAQAGLTSLIGTRVTPVIRPQTSLLPAVTIQRISSAPESSDEGDSDLSSDRVQIDCWGASYGATRGVSRAVKAALSGRRFSHAGTDFQGAFTEDESDTTESGTGNTPIFRTRIDVLIWHKGA